MSTPTQPHKSMSRIAVALASLPPSDQAQQTAAVFLQAFRLASRWIISVYVDPRCEECRSKLEELRVALAQSLECLTHTLTTGEEVNEDVLFPHAVQYLAPASPQTIEDLVRLRDLLRAEVAELEGTPAAVVEGGAE